VSIMLVNTQLSIQQLKLNVHLGWSAEERKMPQTIFLDAEIRLPQVSKACFSDDLNDTFCYDALISSIHQFLERKSLHLLEHLGYELFTFLKTKFPANAHLSLSVTKFPDIAGLTGGIRFTCDDSDSKK
jgi:dihydroneopterin aldolase